MTGAKGTAEGGRAVKAGVALPWKQKRKKKGLHREPIPNAQRLATGNSRLAVKLPNTVLPGYTTSLQHNLQHLCLSSRPIRCGGLYSYMTSVAVPGLWCLLLGSDKWEI